MDNISAIISYMLSKFVRNMISYPQVNNNS